MEEASKLLVYLSGISYLAVGLFLLDKSSKTHGRPELYLGLAFVCNGLSYAFTELPYVLDFPSIEEEFNFIGRAWAVGCAVIVSVFTWRVFRSDAAWAPWLVWGAAAVSVSGLAISAWEGDWEGLYPLTYKGFWFEWAGDIVPYVWLSVESLRKYSGARKQRMLDLIDPLTCNRFLLIGLYGALAASTYVLFIPMYIRFELDGGWSPGMDVALGLIEVVSLAALSISFSAPSFYRRWLGAAEAAHAE